MRMSDKAIKVCEQMQNLYAEHNLDSVDGICCAADFFIWAIMLPFASKDECKEQIRAMLPSMLANVDANWEGLQARRKVIEALDNGESGGRLQ